MVEKGDKIEYKILKKEPIIEPDDPDYVWDEIDYKPDKDERLEYDGLIVLNYNLKHGPNIGSLRYLEGIEIMKMMGEQWNLPTGEWMILIMEIRYGHMI